jgi:hypothetical protein
MPSDIKVSDAPKLTPGQQIRIRATGELTEILRITQEGSLSLKGYAALINPSAVEPLLPGEAAAK